MIQYLFLKEFAVKAVPVSKQCTHHLLRINIFHQGHLYYHYKEMCPGYQGCFGTPTQRP